MKLIPSSCHPSLGAGIALAALAGVVLVPSALAAAPGNYGSVDLSYVQSVAGFARLSTDIADTSRWGFDGFAIVKPGPSYLTSYSLTDLHHLEFNVTGGTAGLPTGTLYGFCADYSKRLVTGASQTYEAVPLSSIGYYSDAAGTGGVLPKLPNAQGIAQNGIGTAKANLIEALANVAYASVEGNNVNAAAFQLAMWKITAEPLPLDEGVPAKWGFDQTTVSGYMGIFSDYTLSGQEATIVNQASSFLTAALAEYQSASGNVVPDYAMYAVTKVAVLELGTYYGQDLVLFTAVPEPQTYALAAGLGLLGFGLYRRSRSQG